MGIQNIVSRTTISTICILGQESTTDTLVVSTHGFIKKRSKVPDNEIQKAVNIRTKYLADKQVKNKKK